MILIVWFPWQMLWLWLVFPAMIILLILIGYWKRERKELDGKISRDH